MELDRLAARVMARAEGQPRIVVAIAGPPASGKSALAEALVARLNAAAPGSAAEMPMDGYHLDNAVLDELGLAARKGAPATFDAAAYAADLARLRAASGPVHVPLFDRRLDLARAFARRIGPEVRAVVSEGNYLLLDEPPWAALAGRFDLELRLDVPEAELRARLVRRWLDHGLPAAAAAARAEANDLPNARLIAARSRPAELVLDWSRAPWTL